jgi:hypothetical protein
VNPTKSQAIKRYFMQFPKPALWMIGGSCLIIYIWGPFVAYGLAWLAIVASGSLIAFWLKRPSDAEMDLWTDEIMAEICPRALEKSHLDVSEQVRDPVMIASPRLRGLGGAFFGITHGRDRKIRFTPLHTTVINFTQHQLVIYQCALDLTTGKALNEAVDEYFYQDIVSVTTQSQSWTFTKEDLGHPMLARCPGIKKSLDADGKLQLNSAETFVLTTSGATSVRVVLKDPILIESLGGGEIPTERADQAVQAVRKMLRDRKAR